ncbi:MAG: GNAT family N-acetyltransferase [Planctomycetaceae bacterium]|nr:GNAT family N-acetyltransferase [Planctomycetaceae bacterium]MCB9951740.1 GNAT family N-acetyltransferase [Planctomycetaceae bacterium]
MLDEQFPEITLPLSAEQLSWLPRNPAYAYRVEGNEVRLTPEPKVLHALLPFKKSSRAVVASDELSIRKLSSDDWPELRSLFFDAFSASQPFSLLSVAEAQQLADACATRTEQCEDGPLVESACHVMFQSRGQRIVGASLVTLTPAGPLTDFSHPDWKSTPPDDAVPEKWGRPHLTWVFVSPSYSRRGLASRLLHSSIAELQQLGFAEMSSTFLADNTPSLLWHWQMGFELPH